MGSDKSMMATQTWASLRNELFEMIVTYSFDKILHELKREGIIDDFNPTKRQMEYSASNCQTIFDNYFTIKKSKGDVEFWIQITYYKGNNKKKEANKTYEARETIVESLFLNSNFSKSKRDFRSIHITIGNDSYAYGWITDMKRNVFDLSINIDPKISDLEIEKSLSKFKSIKTLIEVKTKIVEDLEKKDELIGKIHSELRAQFKKYISNGILTNSVYRMQADVIRGLNKKDLEVLYSESTYGEDIKSRVIKEILSPSEMDSSISTVAKQQVKKKPFLSIAMDILADYNKLLSSVPNCGREESINHYFNRLWNIEGDIRLVVRRILLRKLLTNTQYIQDIEASGITEHNLYQGIHTDLQVKQIIDSITKSNSSDRLKNLIGSVFKDKKENLSILKELLAYEIQNGTTIKPSLEYIKVMLQPEFSLLPAKLIGYHSKLSEEKVKAFENLYAVQRTRKGKKEIVGYIKVKYFRKQEFARRCKEESFVSIMARHDLSSKGSLSRSVDKPFLMFIDKENGYQPQRYALEMLYSSGWELFFDISKMKKSLSGL